MIPLAVQLIHSKVPTDNSDRVPEHCPFDSGKAHSSEVIFPYSIERAR